MASEIALQLLALNVCHNRTNSPWQYVAQLPVDDLVAINKVFQNQIEYSFGCLIVASSVSCLLARMESLMYIQSVDGFVCSELIQKAAV